MIILDLIGLVLIAIAVGVFAFFITLEIQEVLTNMAKDENFFGMAENGTVVGVANGGNIVKIHINQPGKIIDEKGDIVEGKMKLEGIDKFLSQWGVFWIGKGRIWKFPITKKEKDSSGKLQTVTKTAGKLYIEGSYYGEIFDAEAIDKTPMYILYRYTLGLKNPLKAMTKKDPNNWSSIDSALVSAFGCYLKTKTFEEILQIKVENEDGKVRPEVLEKVIDVLNSKLANRSLEDAYGVEILDLNIEQIKIGDPKIEASSRKKIEVKEEQEAEIQKRIQGEEIAKRDRVIDLIKAETERDVILKENEALKDKLTIMVEQLGKEGAAFVQGLEVSEANAIGLGTQQVPIDLSNKSSGKKEV